WIATPGTIAGEMETTKTVIDELAHTIHDRYRALYLDAHDAAFREDPGRALWWRSVVRLYFKLQQAMPDRPRIVQ
ncbi:MAG: hypothetical protein MJE77_22210, partial [Proteobacteria bacterium]|nr:hypothetical protein [Pseudomonadota bacterium]